MDDEESSESSFKHASESSDESSYSSSESDGSTQGGRMSRTPKGHRKDKELNNLMEENPEVYGLRRSGRSRKEPERLTLKKVQDERRARNTNRHKFNSSEDSDDYSSSSSDTFRPNRKASGSWHCSSSRGRGQPRTTSRRSAKQVSYREESEGATDSDDVIYPEEDEGAEEVNEDDANVEMIELVFGIRRGKKGAIGSKTTLYNIQENGDPNELLPVDEYETQYYIKWKGWSHLHNTWETEPSLREQKVKGLKKLENYMKRQEEIASWRREANPEDIEFVECQIELQQELQKHYTEVERIISHLRGRSGSIDFLCKWNGLPYSESTWEDGTLLSKKFQAHIDEYYERINSQNIPSKQCKVLRYRPKFVPLESQPTYIGGPENLQLRDYQLSGLNWLIHSWCKENSVILADEMGLGKTIQTISYLSYLFHDLGLYGPFLLVVPLSTMQGWQKEFAHWAPDLNVVTYLGDVASRETIRTYEWSHPNHRLKFNAILTTYEILLKDKSWLGRESWAALVVDEAHRLKNDDSLLYRTLKEFDTNHRVLVTGTPLQNSLQELWALLHFIMPSRFPGWSEFQQEHSGVLAQRSGFEELHKQLQPFMLRRVKKDVEKSLPAKVEQILRVEMTAIQKQYSKWILTKNYRALSKGVKGSVTGFSNIVMELKKCCNHASLVRANDQGPQESLQSLMRGSGKLILLDKLLCRLRETGHRVLIFSQMVRMLDILAEYLQLRRFPFQRLDGSIKGEVRKQALELFNKEDSEDFCFLLSTRAGGLGINLATADTVIIYDSDWNPQNDLQAQARAHRIGQKNQVNIYRLVTRNSVEEDIIERAKRKMVLDHLVIQRMDTTGRTVLNQSQNTTPFDKEELNAILRFGAVELFRENEGEEQEPQVDIDEILRRAETREDDHNAGNDDLLSQFKVASFAALEPDEDEEEPSHDDWDSIIPAHQRLKFETDEKEQQLRGLELGPRARKQVTLLNYGPDDEWKPKEEAGDESASESGDDKSSRRKRGRAFTNPEIRKFVRAYRKFPDPLNRLDAIAEDAELQEKSVNEIRELAIQVHNGALKAMKEEEAAGAAAASSSTTENPSAEEKQKRRGPTFQLQGVTINAQQIVNSENYLKPLGKLIPNDKESRKKFVFPYALKSVHWDCEWNQEDDSALLVGVYEYGLGSWDGIRIDPELGLGEKILRNDKSKPQATHLQTRLDYLLKLTQKYDANQGKATKREAKPKKPKPEKTEKATKREHESREDGAVPKKKRKTKEEAAGKKPSKSKVKSAESQSSVKSNSSDLLLSEDSRGADDDELNKRVFAQCKELMRPMRKALKALDLGIDTDDPQEQMEHMKKCLIKIGDHICQCIESKSNVDEKANWTRHLWSFVAKFTEFTGRKLRKVYRMAVKRNEHGVGGEHDGGNHVSGRQGSEPNKERKDTGKAHHDQQSRSATKSSSDSRDNSRADKGVAPFSSPLKENHHSHHHGHSDHHSHHSHHSSHHSSKSSGSRSDRPRNDREERHYHSSHDNHRHRPPYRVEDNR